VGIGQLDIRSFGVGRRAFPEVVVGSVGAPSSLAPRRSGLRSPQAVDYARYMLLREDTWRPLAEVYRSPNPRHWHWPVGWGRSTIPDAGWGLFALRQILRGELLCTYEGFAVRWGQYLSGSYRSSYLLVDEVGRRAVDAADFASCLARFVNDILDNCAYNCHLEVTTRPMSLWADEDTPVGFEFFTPYGAAMTWSCPVLRSRAALVCYVPASVASPTVPEPSFDLVRSSRFQQRLDNVLQHVPTVLHADASTLVGAGSVGGLDVRRFPEVSVGVSLADDVGDPPALVDLSEEVTQPLASEGPPPLIDIMEVVSRP
jgi:hypothetical protein